MERILIGPKGRKFYVPSAEKDYHCQYGQISSEELVSPDGTKIRSNKGTGLFVMSPSFIDHYEKIRRLAQIIPLKDVGSIIAHCGIGKDTTVLDAGSGSGALACFLGHIAKKVSTCDIREDHHNITKKNIEKLGLENVQAHLCDICDPANFDTEYDVVTLDMPEPWSAIPTLKKVLKIGGFCASYSPCIPQSIDFVNGIEEESSFYHLITLEILEREWEISRRKVRPVTTQVIHSGFLTFIRRIGF